MKKRGAQLTDREFKIRLWIYRLSPVILGIVIMFYLFTEVVNSDTLVMKTLQYYGILMIYAWCSARLAKNLIYKHTGKYGDEEETNEV